MVEHRTLNPLVEGSSPSALTSFGHRVAFAPPRRFRAAMSFSVPPPGAFGATAGIRGQSVDYIKKTFVRRLDYCPGKNTNRRVVRRSLRRLPLYELAW